MTDAHYPRRPPARLLPTGEELCAAIRGHHIGDHPLTRLAAALGVLHQRRPAAREEFDRDRTGLVRAVDTWAAHHLPVPRPGAPVHTEALGAVLDRLAAAQVDAYRLLMTLDPAGPQVHAAWSRLAELVNGYTDLATELTRRSRGLPTHGEP